MMFLSLILTSSSNALGSHSGNVRAKPMSVSIDEVTRKKISKIKEISAVDEAFSPGIFLFFLAILSFF